MPTQTTPADSADKSPYYLLVSHAAQPAATGLSSILLSHPVIQYHYADDSPLSLLPRFPAEQVLVLDHDPTPDATPRARSIAGRATVTDVRMTDAPGAGATPDDQGKSRKMFILQTTGFEENSIEPQEALARFRQRNSVLRQVLEYDPQLQVHQSS
ncbi:hypothetical protein FA95DRAFT_1568632 [Auriscalpium vulgare]|uniref:Uncharacterized protein n=1 Tax=Auriscalpium vulgare TaxID=40419 RepID=A0ACB8SBI1_9AGAM|nr:hypothetical protein FA95DRAFT_1568632 [Auriscalpium vulgare]